MRNLWIAHEAGARALAKARNKGIERDPTPTERLWAREVIDGARQFLKDEEAGE